MPLIEGTGGHHDAELSARLTARFTARTDGRLGDTSDSGRAIVIFERQMFEHIQDTLERTFGPLGRRYANAMAEVEAYRWAGVEWPSNLFGKWKKRVALISEEYEFRGIGSVSKATEGTEITILARRSVRTSLLAGALTAAFEQLTECTHRMRWEDDRDDGARITLEATDRPFFKPEETITSDEGQGERPESELIHDAGITPDGIMTLEQVPSIIFPSQFFDALVMVLETLQEEGSPALTDSRCEWDLPLPDGVDETTRDRVWTMIATAISEGLEEHIDELLVAEAEHWRLAINHRLARSSLCSAVNVRQFGEHGEIELEFASIIHPAILSGVLLALWQVAEHRIPRIKWQREEGVWIASIEPWRAIAT